MYRCQVVPSAVCRYNGTQHNGCLCAVLDLTLQPDFASPMSPHRFDQRLRNLVQLFLLRADNADRRAFPSAAKRRSNKLICVNNGLSNHPVNDQVNDRPPYENVGPASILDFPLKISAYEVKRVGMPAKLGKELWRLLPLHDFSSNSELTSHGTPRLEDAQNRAVLDVRLSSKRS